MSGMSASARLVLEGVRELLADPVGGHELRVLLSEVTEPAPAADGWLDSRAAAEHVGLTLDAFKKSMHEIPSSQAGPGCKRYFRRSDLDKWRSSATGGASIPLPKAA